jgi:hypothetical protein
VGTDSATGIKSQRLQSPLFRQADTRNGDSEALSSGWREKGRCHNTCGTWHGEGMGRGFDREGAVFQGQDSISPLLYQLAHPRFSSFPSTPYMSSLRQVLIRERVALTTRLHDKSSEDNTAGKQIRTKNKGMKELAEVKTKELVGSKKERVVVNTEHTRESTVELQGKEGSCDESCLLFDAGFEGLGVSHDDDVNRDVLASFASVDLPPDGDYSTEHLTDILLRGVERCPRSLDDDNGSVTDILLATLLHQAPAVRTTTISTVTACEQCLQYPPTSPSLPTLVKTSSMMATDGAGSSIHILGFGTRADQESCAGCSEEKPDKNNLYDAPAMRAVDDNVNESHRNINANIQAITGPETRQPEPPLLHPRSKESSCSRPQRVATYVQEFDTFLAHAHRHDYLVADECPVPESGPTAVVNTLRSSICEHNRWVGWTAMICFQE